jgi:hypothetical protein
MSNLLSCSPLRFLPPRYRLDLDRRARTMHGVVAAMRWRQRWSVGIYQAVGSSRSYSVSSESDSRWRVAHREPAHVDMFIELFRPFWWVVAP